MNATNVSSRERSAYSSFLAPLYQAFPFDLFGRRPASGWPDNPLSKAGAGKCRKISKDARAKTAHKRSRKARKAQRKARKVTRQARARG